MKNVHNKKYCYSIIIPHYNIINLLERALLSIPDREDIQILVVDDNSGIAEDNFEKLNTFKKAKCEFIFTKESKGAGYVRNVGLTRVLGKWLLFLDADDFFSENAFDIFDKYINSDNEIIYFNTTSVYSDTLEPSNRFGIYKTYVEFCDNIDENKKNIIKFGHSVPVAKMIRNSLVVNNNILFDETKYCNDSMFAVKVAACANRIYVDKSVVYVVTERAGSLVTNPNKEALRIRYEVQLRVNKFIRDIGMSKYQNSLLFYWQESLKFGFFCFMDFVKLGIKYSGFNIHTVYLARKRVLKILADKSIKK